MGVNKTIFSPKIIAIMRKLAIAGADAAKVRMERFYDIAFKTKAGQKIIDLPTLTKHLIEVVIYGAHGMLYGKFEPESPLGLLIKEVAEDLPAEFGRRMMNGDLKLSSHGKPVVEADFVQNCSLFELTPEEIRELTQWFPTLTSEQKIQFKTMLNQMSFESLRSMMASEEKSRTILLEILGPNANPKKRKLFENTFSGIKHEIDEFNNDLGGVLKSIQARRKARNERRTKRRGR